MNTEERKRRRRRKLGTYDVIFPVRQSKRLLQLSLIPIIISVFSVLQYNNGKVLLFVNAAFLGKQRDDYRFPRIHNTPSIGHHYHYHQSLSPKRKNTKLFSSSWFSNDYDDDDDKVGPYSELYIDEQDEYDNLQCVLLPETDDDETCDVDSSSSSSMKSLLMSKEEKDKTALIDKAILILPLIIPLWSYFTYEDVAKASAFVMDGLARNKNWVAVDGGAYQAKILAPAINGIVISSISILFGTLISETITTLRQRQQDIRTNIHREAGELRILQALVESFPDPYSKERAISYLIQYCSRVLCECQPMNIQNEKLLLNVGPTRNLCGDSEMTGFLNQLNEINNSPGRKFSDAILAECYMSVSRLNSERSERISSIQSGFPSLHYAILTVLALTILFAFLLETNQDILIFLNAIQLRILWGMLVGVFSALGIVCYDLVDPFRGSYQITPSIDQLYTIRNALRASAKNANAASIKYANNNNNSASLSSKGGKGEEERQFQAIMNSTTTSSGI